MNINERIIKLREVLKLSAPKFAAPLGVTRSAIYEIEKGRNQLSEQMLIAICRVYNVSDEWLRHGHGEMFIQTKSGFLSGLAKRFSLDDRDIELIKTFLSLPEPSREVLKSFIISAAEKMAAEDADTVSERKPTYQTLEVVGAAAAGQGYIYPDEQVKQYRQITVPTLPHHDLALDVSGDSMLPTLSDGDVIFLQRTTDKLSGRIYALDLGGEVVVKRAYFEPKSLRLVSDNPEWQDRTIVGAALEDVKIIGLVVGWATPTK